MSFKDLCSEVGFRDKRRIYVSRSPFRSLCAPGLKNRSMARCLSLDLTSAYTRPGKALLKLTVGKVIRHPPLVHAFCFDAAPALFVLFLLPGCSFLSGAQITFFRGLPWASNDLGCIHTWCSWLAFVDSIPGSVQVT